MVEPNPRGSYSRRRLIRYVVGVGLIGVGGAAGAAFVNWPRTTEPTQRRPPTTTTIVRGNLVEVVTVTGRLGYGPRHRISSRLEGTVTALPAVGTVLDRGDVVFRIDDKPVVLLFGQMPAFRDLAAGGSIRGGDVRQLEENLQKLGYAGFTIDDEFTEATSSAVRRWQRDLGVSQTGTVELGRIVYAPDAIRVAGQEIALGEPAAGAVLSYTGTARLVTAPLQAHQQSLAEVKAKVTVALSAGAELPGTVVSVGPADEAPGTADQSGVQVFVALDEASTDGLGDGPVRVRFPVQERKDVLIVPLGALLALAEGGYGLELVEDGPTRIVAVTTGLFANGRVEVSGPELLAGATVVMAQ